MEPWLNIERGL